MNNQNVDELRNISARVIECWTRIKAKARQRGDVTNIEKHVPCITAALNQMENFLHELTKEEIRINRLNKERNDERIRLAREIPMWGTDGD